MNEQLVIDQQFEEPLVGQIEFDDIISRKIRHHRLPSNSLKTENLQFVTKLFQKSQA